jgi:hypothetical protein
LQGEAIRITAALFAGGNLHPGIEHGSWSDAAYWDTVWREMVAGWPVPMFVT